MHDCFRIADSMLTFTKSEENLEDEFLGNTYIREQYVIFSVVTEKLSAKQCTIKHMFLQELRYNFDLR